MVWNLSVDIVDTVDNIYVYVDVSPDVQLEEGGGVGLVEGDVGEPGPGAGLRHIPEHRPVELEPLPAQPACHAEE